MGKSFAGSEKTVRAILVVLGFISLGAAELNAAWTSETPAWTSETPEGSLPYGYWTALALDSKNSPRMIYRSGSTGGNLRYVRKSSGTWVGETIESGFDSNGGHCSLAISSFDNPRATFYKTNVGLRFASRGTSNWSVSTIDPLGGQYTSLKLDSSDNPHISYFASNSLKYARWNGVAWSTTTVDTGGVVGMWTSLALSSQGFPRISYYDSSNGNLKFAEWDGTAWSTQTVMIEGNSGKYTSLALDPSGRPAISCLQDSKLVFAQWTGSTWEMDTVATDGKGVTSLIMDGNGVPSISYESFSSALKFVTRHGSVWSSSTVDVSYGAYSSLARGTDGLFHVSYGTLYFKYAGYFPYSAPSSVTSGTKTSDSITWLWTDNSSEETGYRVLQANGLTPISDDLPPNTTSWIQSGMGQNESSKIAVQAVYGNLTQNSVNSPTVFTLALPPTNTSVISSTWTNVTVGWSANNNSPSTLYQLDKSENGITFSQVFLGTSTIASVPLSEDTTNFFRVRAQNGNGVATAYDTVVSTYLNFQVPAPSGTPSAFNVTAGSVSWSWSDKSKKETGFRVLRASDLTPLSEDLPANTTQWTQTQIPPNTLSQVVVQTFNGAGGSNSPPSAAFYTLAVPPKATSVVSSSGTTISLTWSGNGNSDETLYEIERSDNGILFVKISSGTNTGIVVSSLADAATHYFRVRALNGASTPTAYDLVVSAYLPAVTPPPPPTNLIVQSLTNDALFWSWTHNSPKESGFRVLRSSDSYVLATLPANTTFWAQTEMGVNVQSQIQVEAFNEFGSSRTQRSYYSWQEFTSANTPIGTFISSVTATTISVSWDFNGNPENTFYNAYISSDGVTYKMFKNLERTPPLRATGLESEKTYYLKLTAKNQGFLETLPDVVVSTRTTLGPPGMANPFEKERHYGYIVWSWENQPNALGYRIYARGGNKLAELPAGQNTWEQFGLGTYESSEIQVESYNIYGSSWSLFGHGTTLANPPNDLRVTKSGRTFATLEWSSNGNPGGIYYEIEKSTMTPFPSYVPFEDSHYLWGGSTITTITGLMTGTTYYFRASAGNNFNTYSSIVSVYTSTGMDAPISPSVTSNSIVWQWNDDVEGETGYRILQSSDSMDLSGLLPANQLTWTQTGLEPNTAYQVSLQAEGSFGTSLSPSSEKIYTRPRSPKAIRLVGVGSDKISLVWEANGNPVGTNYIVFQQFSENGETYINIMTEVEGTSVTLRGLSPLHTYFLFVSAQGPGGDSFVEESEESGPLAVTTTAKPERFITSDPSLVVETVDQGEETGAYSAITINDDNPVVYYASGASGDLMKATLSDSLWETKTLVSNAHISSRISAITMASEYSRVAYHSGTQGKLNLGIDFGPEFFTSEIPMDSFSSNGNTISFSGQGFQGTSLALNKQNSPVVVYSSNYPASGSNSGLYFFYEATLQQNTPSWEKTLLATKVLKKLGGQSSSGVGDIQLAIDSNDVSHVVYFHCDDQELFPSAVGDIIYARKEGGQWVSEIVDKKVATEYTAIDIKVDLQNLPHIIYSDPVHKLVRHAVKDTSGWRIENIDDNKSVGFVALAMDTKGNPHAVYTDVEAGDIYYAHQTNGHWDRQMIDGSQTGETGWFPSIAIDSLDNVHMAFQDVANQSLKYASLSTNPTEIKSLVETGGGRFEFLGSRGPIRLEVPSGTFTQTVLLTVRAPTLFPVPASLNPSLTPLGFGLEIQSDPLESPARPVTVTLSYGEDMLAGHAESHLVLAYYDKASGEWKAVPTRVDSAKNQLTAAVSDISLLQVMYDSNLPPPNEIIAYPNPMRPNLPGHDLVTFTNLPLGARLKIYTLRGEIVREVDEQGNQGQWNGRNNNGEPVASGVYFVRIESSSGEKILKVAVQR